MDLNMRYQGVLKSIASWLPRGAMDLNQTAGAKRWNYVRWLPRGAMDLNLKAEVWPMTALRLAPSWSHGSKYA